MDKEKAKKLDKMIREQRIRTYRLPGIILLLLASFFAIYFYDVSSTAQTKVTGQVISWTRVQSYTGAGDYIVSVKLTDGTTINARLNQSAKPPKNGKEIKLTKSISRLGRTQYTW